MSHTTARRVALIHRPAGRDRPEDDFIRAIVRRFTPELVTDRLPVGEPDLGRLRHMDAVIVYWPYRWLHDAPELGFGALPGKAVMLEHDAFGDFSSWGSLQGTWPTTFHRHGFDLLICSGHSSLEHFTRMGVQAAVVHKGVSIDRFQPLDRPRQGLCTYGTDYTSRVMMKRKLVAAGIEFSDATSPYATLNSRLNEYCGMATTVRGTKPRFGAGGRLLQRLRPGTFVRQEAAPEPMMKVFEAAAAGCAVFTDDVADLAVLGFANGKNIVTFSDLDDCVEVVRHYSTRHDEMLAIGKAGANLVKERHSWDQRAIELERAIFPPQD